MRNDWRKRLGAIGAVVLLNLTMLGGALATAAHAADANPNATAELDVQIVLDNTLSGSLQRSDFSFSINGGAPINFQLGGLNQFFLDPAAGPYTITGVAEPGYTTTTQGCDNLTLVVGTPTVCLIFNTGIAPPTTTTTTTTTTTIPVSSTTAGQGQTSIHGSFTDINGCNSVLVPPVAPAGTTPITVTLSSDASPQPHFGDPITLSNTKLGLSIPATLLQAGVKIGLISDGLKVPSVITLGVAGQNTQEKTHKFVVNTTATIHVVKGQAQPLVSTLSLGATSWTPSSKDANVYFSEQSMKIVSTIDLGSAGLVIATFTCSPSAKIQPFVAVGANGTPAPPPPTTGTGQGTTVPGGTGTSATAAATGELPVTGSNPWPLVVLAAVLIDLGLLALGGAKRGRRLLRR